MSAGWAGQTKQILLLRGINLGARNRVSMSALAAGLTDIGFQDVRTYLQSGNVVLTSENPPKQTAALCRQWLQDSLELTIPVIARTRDELVAVVAANPLGDVAVNPKLYQVTFLEAAPSAQALAALEAAAQPAERLLALGRELYSWHPDGIARSKLTLRLTAKDLGAGATVRNWATVSALLALADE